MTYKVYEDNTDTSEGCGYLISYDDFMLLINALRNGDSDYVVIADRLQKNGWDIATNSIIISGRDYSEISAYELFCKNHSLHEHIYNHCMDIWR